MKLYSLLILAKNTKKSKNNFKAPKKSEIVVFPGRILPCKQNKSAILKLHNCFVYFIQKIYPWKIVFYFFILPLRLLSY